MPGERFYREVLDCLVSIYEIPSMRSLTGTSTACHGDLVAFLATSGGRAYNPALCSMFYPAQGILPGGNRKRGPIGGALDVGRGRAPPTAT